MAEFCKVDKSDHIMTVTINRPERLNALHPPANAELGEVFDDYAADDDMWVAIITGEGRGFSAGNDLRYQAEGGARVPDAARLRRADLAFRSHQAGVRRGQRRRHGGWLRDRARVRHHHRLREPPFSPFRSPSVGFGGTGRRAAATAAADRRAKRALGMILTGRHVPAREGYDLGIRKCRRSPTTNSWRRRTSLGADDPRVRPPVDPCQQGCRLPEHEHGIAGGVHGRALRIRRHAVFGSEDYIEGPRAFSEKRPPNWQGR